jgi:hypothetical protein
MLCGCDDTPIGEEGHSTKLRHWGFGIAAPAADLSAIMVSAVFRLHEKKSAREKLQS